MSEIYTTVESKHFNEYSNEGHILKQLVANAESWVTAKELSKCINCEHETTYVSVRFCVAVLRDRGEPIVSGNKGFMFTTNREEIIKCITALNKRILGIQRAVAGLEVNLHEVK